VLLVVFAAAITVAAPHEGASRVLVRLGAAVAAAVLLDLALSALLRRRLIWPDGAALTGIICALVIALRDRWWLAAAAALIGVGSKHLLRTRRVHFFNPAALGLLLTLWLFSSSQSWWGGFADLPAATVLPLILVGVWLARYVGKLPQVLAFLGTYFGLFSATAFFSMGGGVRLAEVYRVPFLNAALFFAFFMLTDPPTSAGRHEDQLVFGALSAAIAFTLFLTVHDLSFLLLALLAANVWLADRRRRRERNALARVARRQPIPIVIKSRSRDENTPARPALADRHQRARPTHRRPLDLQRRAHQKRCYRWSAGSNPTAPCSPVASPCSPATSTSIDALPSWRRRQAQRPT
jgi:Na+-translocating ferredoxin:NAD+ oxidoreductase RnfD subunit